MTSLSDSADQLIKPKALMMANLPTSGALANVLINHARDGLAHYKRPRRIEFVEALPKAASGRIQRYKLR